jgi:hypothetical protein
MEDRQEGLGGFTLLDGAAVVIGAAVSSVHIRGALPPRGLPGGVWVILWFAFAGIALTAAGPFVFLGRRFGRRTAGYPRVGDLLWAMWGLPWCVTAMMRTASTGAGPHRHELVGLGLTIGLGASALIAGAVVWTKWVLVPPEQVRREEPTPWTNRVGLILSVAWPLQCGFGLLVVEGGT